ncbi:MAG TPA: hypothetical protein VGH28_30245 [Polyangiaceae bacterium]|jgi:hypothetical protein
MLNKSVIVIAFVLTAAIACHKDESAASTTSSTAAATAAAAPAAKDKSVDLAPLPLTVKMPAEESAIAMDMSMGENKSVSVSYEAVNAGFNVSEPAQKSFAELKKEYKGDTVLFPFKKWVKDGDTSAVEEFSNDGKTGYMALSWKKVGGKSYVCKSNGLSGLASPADADKVLAICDTLAAK